MLNFSPGSIWHPRRPLLGVAPPPASRAPRPQHVPPLIGRRVPALTNRTRPSRHGDGRRVGPRGPDRTRAGTMAGNRYGPGVRMGHWNEDVYLEEVRGPPRPPRPARAQHPEIPSGRGGIAPAARQPRPHALPPFPRVPRPLTPGLHSPAPAPRASRWRCRPVRRHLAETLCSGRKHLSRNCPTTPPC